MFCKIGTQWEGVYVHPTTVKRFHLRDVFRGYEGNASVGPDTISSYRTGRGEADDDLSRMLNNEEYNPIKAGDKGHPFNLHKHYVSNLVTPYFSGRGTKSDFGGRKHWNYSGPMGLFSIGTGNYPDTFNGIGNVGFEDIPDGIPASYGAKAISATSPTKSEANVATALLELKDGFPRMIGSSLRKKRGSGQLGNSVGDEYLNLMFGWVPTLGDLKSIAGAMVNAPKIINQYMRDSDKIVRRKFRFPTETSSKYGNTDLSYLGKKVGVMLAQPDVWNNSWNIGRELGQGLDFDLVGARSISATEQRTDKIWFSGAFRYHLAADSDILSRIDRTSQIAHKWLGAGGVDLNTFWQLMPWSWFIDWFVDVGDIIDNANSALLNGQVLQYGYLMRETTVKRAYTTDSAMIYRGSDATQDRQIGFASTTYVSQRKQRVKATPYGFGLNPDTFSAQQWAILGALGLSKGPRKL
jgi:hypothetical protein